MNRPTTLLERVRTTRHTRNARTDGDGAQADGGPPPAAGRRRRALAAAALATGVAAIAWLAFGGGSDEDAGTVQRAGATATVERQTLVEREDVEGTLGYSGKRTVVHRSESSAGGAGSGGASGGTSSGLSPSAASATSRTAFASYTSAQSGDGPNEEGDESPEDPGDTPADPELPAEDDQRDKNGPSDDDDQDAGGQTGGGQTGGDPSAAAGGAAGGAAGSGSGGGDASDASAAPTLTAVARAGSVVRRGGVLYRASGEPVVLMYGSTPAYRSLSSGVEDGRDVEQLERNLAALGFGSLTVDREYTSATAAAVSEWQESLGVEETGTVELGRVVFLPGPRRMGAADADVGSILTDGSEVVATTSTDRVVTIELPAGDQSLARKGARVTVTLPDGSGTRGRISSVGKVAREPESEDSAGGLGGEGGSSGEPVIDVTVKLRRERATSRLDEAPVTVGLARETRRGVLAVPVTALLAEAGGGYAVEVVSGGARRSVPVETGLFASGLVEVSGKGIAEGMRVAVPE